jgi:putative membrane protein
MMHGFYGHGWGMGWSWILGLVVLMTIIWLVVKVAIQNNTTQSKDKSALDILKERYAKGEISKEEFEEKKRDIS